MIHLSLSILCLTKISEKPDFADEIDIEFFFDGGGHLFGKLPDILRGTAGISDDDVGVFLVEPCAADAKQVRARFLQKESGRFASFDR